MEWLYLCISVIAKKIVVVGVVVIGVISPVGYVAIWRTTTRGHKTYEEFLSAALKAMQHHMQQAVMCCAF